MGHQYARSLDHPVRVSVVAASHVAPGDPPSRMSMLVRFPWAISASWKGEMLSAERENGTGLG